MDPSTKKLHYARSNLRNGLNPSLSHYSLRRGLVSAMRSIREMSSQDHRVWNVLGTIETGLIQDDLGTVGACAKQAAAMLDELLDTQQEARS